MSRRYVELCIESLFKSFSFSQYFEESEVVVWVDVSDVDDSEVLQVSVDVLAADAFDQLRESSFAAVEEDVEMVVRRQTDG